MWKGSLALAFSFSVALTETDIEIEEVITDDSVNTNRLYSACNSLENGVHWVRPIAGEMESGDEFPNVQVRCHNSWTILDYSLDKEIANYFSSFSSWTEYAASSSLDDRVTWREWFVPSNDDDTMKFRISEDCNECASTADYEDDSTFYMTGNYIGCLWVTKGFCDMDPDTLTCYTCSTNSDTTEYSGLCTHMEMSSDSQVYTEHDLCTTNSFNAVPSLGTNGQYCVCYQPETVSLNEAAFSYDRNEEDTDEDRSADTLVQIFNSDFTHGTYRITQPGTYTLMEDIIVDMNAPDNYDAPNDVDAWYPMESQSDEYEGADGSFVGAYSMGFFAGFAIESHDVTIDLNGYEMRMSKAMNLQQRWYAHVEIGSKAFISGQGPGNFGAFLTQCENIVIKNGILGLSSHHGIHGNSASSITIVDLHIKNFEVAGISLNGFSDLTIENVEVGPSYDEVPVLGVYTQARIMLPRLRKMADDADEDDTVRFQNNGENRRYLTADDIEGSLERQMDAIFYHVIEGKEYDEDDGIWQRASKTFYNEIGIPSASTVYGIFLNSEGASVFALGGAPGNSYNAVIKNVHIHGLINDPWEVPRIMNFKGPFNDIVDVTRVTDNGLTDLKTAKYYGNAYTDAQYAIHELTESWSILSHSAMTDAVISWIKHGTSLKSSNTVKLKCNNDIMLHVTKGVFGLRMDSIDNFEVKNVKIENLQNIGYYGSLLCGGYSSENDGGHRNQRSPMQYGYTGTEVHGMTLINSKGSANNLDISKIISARGDSAGLQVFPGNELILGNIQITDIHAGAYASSNDLLLNTPQNKPNKMPRGCLVDYWTYSDDDDDTLNVNKLTYMENTVRSGQCVSGLTTCSWEYSEEALVNSKECSLADGNLIDWDDIREGETYYNIERRNGGLFTGIHKLLTKQDTDNEDGQNLVPLESNNNNNGNSAANAWIYIIIGIIIFVGIVVAIFRKCLKRRAIITSNNYANNSTIGSSLKKARQNQHNSYNATSSAEYTPLITTGAPF